MRKTIEVEYVGIEDVQEIMEDAFAVMSEGHYVNIEVSSVCELPYVRVYIIFGGWNKDKDYDYNFEFHISDKLDDVKSMNECKFVLNSILAEED